LVEDYAEEREDTPLVPDLSSGAVFPIAGRTCKKIGREMGLKGTVVHRRVKYLLSVPRTVRAVKLSISAVQKQLEEREGREGGADSIKKSLNTAALLEKHMNCPSVEVPEDFVLPNSLEELKQQFIMAYPGTFSSLSPSPSPSSCSPSRSRS
jgi:hypothetical protein